MKAVIFDGELKYETDYPVPEATPGWAKVRVHLAGICGTDLEIMKGYKGFRGVLGHEFVGVVDGADDPSWVGKRVVGEINAACGACDWCARGLGRHCPERTVLGIEGLDGCMAEYCVLPQANLIPLPPVIPDDRAIFTEPLSAACEILEQLPLDGTERVVVLGDGRLGILCAWVLATVGANVTLIGHHPEKLALARWRGVETSLNGEGVLPGADVVVEATGSAEGLSLAMSLCRPRGAIVLKSTIAGGADLNLSPIVVHEQTVIGSRCGRFGYGLRMMVDFPDMPLECLISGRYPLDRVADAFERAEERDALKVLLEIG